jgi:hypothetical protein
VATPFPADAHAGSAVPVNSRCHPSASKPLPSGASHTLQTCVFRAAAPRGGRTPLRVYSTLLCDASRSSTARFLSRCRGDVEGSRCQQKPAVSQRGRIELATGLWEGGMCFQVLPIPSSSFSVRRAARKRHCLGLGVEALHG